MQDGSKQDGFRFSHEDFAADVGMRQGRPVSQQKAGVELDRQSHPSEAPTGSVHRGDAADHGFGAQRSGSDQESSGHSRAARSSESWPHAARRSADDWSNSQDSYSAPLLERPARPLARLDGDRLLERLISSERKAAEWQARAEERGARVTKLEADLARWQDDFLVLVERAEREFTRRKLLEDTIGDTSDSSFRGRDLRNADFTGADLRDANFDGADLRNASFRRADLRRSDLRDSDLARANAKRVRLKKSGLKKK